MGDNNKKAKGVGQEVVGRLKRFTEQIESLDSAKDLPKVLTVRKVKLDLRPHPLSADEVKAIRKQLRVSQGVFAEFLGVSASTVQDWEQGIYPPSGPACRIIGEMARDIPGWSERLRELAEVTSNACESA